MEFSVLQWNIWYKEDIEKVAEFLKTHPADIITAQELTINPKAKIKNGPAYIAKLLGYNYYYKDLPIKGTDGESRVLANGIFCKHPIKDSRFVWLQEPSGKGGYDDEFRAYIEATLVVNGQELTIGTTHMSYTHRFELTEKKKIETDKLLQEIKKHTKYYIFTGDLNALPGSYTINNVSSLLDNAGPGDSHKSWTTKPFAYNGFEANTLDWRLDYIFHTPDLIPNKSEVLKTDYSDHLPILATFTFG